MLTDKLTRGFGAAFFTISAMAMYNNLSEMKELNREYIAKETIVNQKVIDKAKEYANERKTSDNMDLFSLALGMAAGATLAQYKSKKEQ